MKQKNSHVQLGRSEYNILPGKAFPFQTLEEAAEELSIKKIRLGRMLRILYLPVHKVGTLILIDRDVFKRIRTSLRKNEIRPGRKPNGG